MPTISRLLQITGNYRSLVQNIVSFFGLFCIRDLSFGRAAARRTAPQRPRAMRVGPNEAPKKIGPHIPGFMRFYDSNSGVYVILRFKFREFIQFLDSNFGSLCEIISPIL